MGVRGVAPSMAGGPAARPCPASKIIAPNRESWFFSKRTPEVLTNPLWEVVFCGERGRIKALAEPIFVRGVSPFYDRRTLRPPELEGLRNLPQKFHFPYWGRKGKNKSRYPPKRARVPLRRAFAPPLGRALYSGVYVRSRGGAKRSISGAMARFGGGCGSCGEPWGNLRLRSSPCPDRFPRLSFRHVP